VKQVRLSASSFDKSFRKAEVVGLVSGTRFSDVHSRALQWQLNLSMGAVLGMSITYHEENWQHDGREDSRRCARPKEEDPHDLL